MKVKVEKLFRKVEYTDKEMENASEKIGNRINSTYPTGILTRENRDK